MALHGDEFADVRKEMRSGFAANYVQFERVRGELSLHRWMLASIFALLFAVALKICLR